MITVASRLLTLTILLSAVAGCTYQSPTRFNPTYIMSDTSMPSAQLHIQSFPVSLGMYEDSGLEREEVSCGADGKSHSSYTQLAGFENRGRARAYPPVATVTLPSGPAYFVLTENTDSVNCRVPFSANLEAGGSYEISASVVHVSFMEGRSCVPEIVDKNSGQKIPVLAKLNRPYPQPHVGSCPNDAKDVKE